MLQAFGNASDYLGVDGGTERVVLLATALTSRLRLAGKQPLKRRRIRGVGCEGVKRDEAAEGRCEEQQMMRRCKSCKF